MSLIFRSVKKISRKKRKSRSRTRKCLKDSIEDNPLKFTIEDEENFPDNFPTLNSVYKKDIFGTPVIFKNTFGTDCIRYSRIKTKIHSIVFMKEYRNKSFEELRWEDYQSNRKGMKHFEEKKYLKCLSHPVEYVSKWKTIMPPNKYEFIEPLAKNIFGKFPALSKSANNLEKTGNLPKINEESSNLNKENCTKPPKERSILTNVDKFYQISSRENNPSKEFAIEISKSVCRTTSEIDLKYTKEDINAMNLEKYFLGACCYPAIPYDFAPVNNSYYLPCTNISLAYKNSKQTKQKKLDPTERLWDLLKTNPFGYSPIFDKLDPIFTEGSLYQKLFGLHNLDSEKKLMEEKVKERTKYTKANKFCNEYFRDKLNPYSFKTQKSKSINSLVKDTDRQKKDYFFRKIVKSKNLLLGIDIVSCRNQSYLKI